MDGRRQLLEKTERRYIVNKKTISRVLSCSVFKVFVTIAATASFLFVDCSINVQNNDFSYFAQTDVDVYLKLALDIRDMRKASDKSEKLNIYKNGKNTVSESMTLQKLSLDYQVTLVNTPLYYLYVDSFNYLGQTIEEDEIGSFDGQPEFHYANTLVEDLFNLDKQYIEATGALVLNVMQTYWSALWNVVTACRNKNFDEMIQSLDIAVALYIGEEQERFKSEKGYMIYNMAQIAGNWFGQSNGEAIINTDTLAFFKELQMDITNTNICNEEEGVETVRNIVHSLYKYSNVVLVQMLLHYVQEANESGDTDTSSSSDFIELYALALWPQIHSCNSNLAEKIIDLAIRTDVTEGTVAEVIATIQLIFPCLEIKCEDVGSYMQGAIKECNDLDSSVVHKSLGTYTPISDVRTYSHLDQDLYLSNVFMRYNAYDLALDFYQHGWKSKYSSQEIAHSELEEISSQSFNIFNNYYSEDKYLDFYLRELLTESSISSVYYENQRHNIIINVLQGVVMFLGIIGELTASVNTCLSSQENSVLLWEKGFAMFVGSMQRKNDTVPSVDDGYYTFNGMSLYDLSTYSCAAFQSCHGTSGSIVNEAVINALTNGATQINNKNCNEAQTYLTEKIIPTLLIPLIQGYFSNTMLITKTEQSAVEPLNATQYYYGAAFAFAYGILPYINNSNPLSASIVNANTPNFNGKQEQTINLTAVFDAIRDAATTIPYFNCTLLGTFQYDSTNYNFCASSQTLPAIVANIQYNQPNAADDTNEEPPGTRSPLFSETEASDIAWGRYNFVNAKNALNYSLFTLDVRGMYFSESVDKATEYYNNTSREEVAKLVIVGNDIHINSLREFSTKAHLFMSEDVVYNFFRLALFTDENFDDPGPFWNQSYWAFGDEVEELALGPDNGNSPALAADTVVVLDIWHMITHLLYESVRKCKEQINQPEIIDYAVALWIGQDQEQGAFESGWSIYSVAQDAAELFGFEEGEADINIKLMNQFNEAQTLTGKCDSDANASESLRSLIDDIVRGLTVPLVQSLIYHLSQDNFQYVELYALSFIPQAISCDEGSFEYLRDSLFQGYTGGGRLNEKLTDDLGKLFHCLGIKCDDFAKIGRDEDGSLTLITETLCDEVEMRSSFLELSSYIVNNDSAMELSRLDLDLLQIELLSRANAYGLAYDIYENGRNSRKATGGCNSLKELTQQPDSSLEFPFLKNQDTYAKFNASSFIENLLMDSENEIRQLASRRQISQLVFRTIQTSVTVSAVVSNLYSAIVSCKNSEDGTLQVDNAAALYIGSIEGLQATTNADAQGKFMFSFTKDICSYFNKCDINGETSSNSFLIYAFNDIRDNLDNGECDGALEILNQSVIKMLIVPLLQGLLHFASVIDGLLGSNGNETLADAAAFANSVLPQIYATNSQSSEIISDTLKFPSSDAKNGTLVFDAVRNALNAMGIDCALIGIYDDDSFSVCPANQNLESAPSSPTNLGEDLYISSSYVQDRANIALDVSKIKDFLAMGQFDNAIFVYQKGANSEIHDQFGKAVAMRSLANFSINAKSNMMNNPLFQTTVFALRDKENKFRGFDATMYADTIVRELFTADKEERSSLVTEAAVALNLWMEIANGFFNILSNCKNGTLVEGAGVRFVDEIAAYWIGDGQTAGETNGHVLYALSEKLGAHFNTATGKSRTNADILLLFNELKVQLSPYNACSDVDTFRYVRRIASRIISKMIIVQIQALIYYLRLGDQQRVSIYAYAFVPLVAGCNPSKFQFLKEKLFASSILEKEVESIVAAIRSTLPCFGIKCDEIGIYENEDNLDCTDPSPLTPLTRYKPATDVREYARLDLDILEIDILIQMEAYDAANDVYSNGKHANMIQARDGPVYSLHSLATSIGRSIVPQFSSFKRYFENDDKYADSLMNKALSSGVNLGMMQRRSLAVGVAQSMIIYMAALEAMYESISACESGKVELEHVSARNWDKAAAISIGYLEGTSDGGSSDGKLLWHLSNEYCTEFGTCSVDVPGSSINNDMIESLLYAGRGAILSNSCGELRRAVQGIEPLLLVPLIQGALSVTTKVTNPSTHSESKSTLFTEGYVFSQALLPLIQDIDTQAADVIRNNFELNGKMIPDGRSKVFNAYAGVLDDLDIPCFAIGGSDIVNACDVKSEKPIGIIIIFTLVSLASVVALILVRMRMKKSTENGNKVEFLFPNGELNHTSDIIPSKPSGLTPDFCDTKEPEIIPADDLVYINAVGQATDGSAKLEGQSLT